MSIKKKFNPIIIVFVLSFVYWFYLACTTQMTIIHDAEGFQSLGSMIRDSGLSICYKGDFSREPIYPIIIAASIYISEIFSSNPFSIQVIVQLLVLFLSQWLIFITLKELKVKNIIIFCIVLYVGFSPAFLNSALSSYSEVASYPFIIGIILANIYALKALKTQSRKDIVLSAFFLGMLFVLAAFVKGIFEMIFFVFLAPYIYLLLVFVLKKNKKKVVSIGIFILVVFLTFNSLVVPYKFMKKKFSGDYVITKGRAAYVLYNGAARRAEKMSLKRISSLVVYIIGPGYCNAVFGLDECTFWDTGNLESFMHKDEIQIKLRDAPASDRDKVLIKAAKEKILQHPFQFALLAGIEAYRMFFWESTRIGFVIYPKWLTNLYGNHIIKFVIRFVLGFLCLCATFYLTCAVFKKRKKLFVLDDHESLLSTSGLFILIIIFSNVTVHAILAAAVARHALPIAPLYLIAIAISADRMNKIKS